MTDDILRKVLAREPLTETENIILGLQQAHAEMRAIGVESHPRFRKLKTDLTIAIAEAGELMVRAKTEQERVDARRIIRAAVGVE